MDGQVARDPRRARRRAGFHHVAILGLLGQVRLERSLRPVPRRGSTCTIVGGGDRKGYQQDYRNAREALEEIRFDLAEGADIIMVKPALSYLDIIARARGELDVPMAAYHVSGEYAMIKAAAERGWIDGAAVALEQITAIKRAGADVILTYLARELAEVL